MQAADAALQAARAQLEKNVSRPRVRTSSSPSRAMQRAESLAGQKLVAQSAFDDAQSAYEVAMNRQRSARGQLVVAQARCRRSRKPRWRRHAPPSPAPKRNSATRRIRAPIRGMVLTRDIEIGSPVSSILNLGANATLVMTLGDIKEVFVRGKVDEADIGQVQLGQPARISVETFKDKKFDGKVTQISPMGAEKDNVTTFEVKVSIDNPGNELKANMTANAEIVLEEHPDSLIIPEVGDQLRRAAQGLRRGSLAEPRRAAGRRCRSRSASATAPAPRCSRAQEGRQDHPAFLIGGARPSTLEPPRPAPCEKRSSRRSTTSAPTSCGASSRCSASCGASCRLSCSAPWARASARQRGRAARVRQEHGHRLGRSRTDCRPAANAPAASSLLTADDARGDQGAEARLVEHRQP